MMNEHRACSWDLQKKNKELQDKVDEAERQKRQLEAIEVRRERTRNEAEHHDNDGNGIQQCIPTCKKVII